MRAQQPKPRSANGNNGIRLADLGEFFSYLKGITWGMTVKNRAGKIARFSICSYSDYLISPSPYGGIQTPNSVTI